MKKSIATALLALLAGFGMAKEPHFTFEWDKNDIPVIREEPNVKMAFGRDLVPTYNRQAHVDLTLGVDDVTHLFHFTGLWWLRDQLYYAKRSRDEKAIETAREIYEMVEAEAMNDVLWLGAPRELLILDEPE